MDDVDKAGLAYLITEYENLIALEVGPHGNTQRILRNRAKVRKLALVWARLRGLNTAPMDVVIADAYHYREHHPGDTEAYIARDEVRVSGEAD